VFGQPALLAFVGLLGLTVIFHLGQRVVQGLQALHCPRGQLFWLTLTLTLLLFLLLMLLLLLLL